MTLRRALGARRHQIGLRRAAWALALSGGALGWARLAGGDGAWALAALPLAALDRKSVV